MSHRDVAVRTLTISLPAGRVDFSDRESVRQRFGCSRLIARAPTGAEAMSTLRRAAEGYRFHAGGADEPAATGAGTVAETWESGGEDTWPSP